MTLKILGLVHSCKGCPKRQYYSAGQYKCELVDKLIPDENIVSAFCPLADFPSELLASMDTTIRNLRAPYKYGMVHSILSHIATKLGVLLDERLSVKFTLKDGSTICIFPDHITQVDLSRGAEIQFLFDGKKYKLSPDARPASLFESVKQEGIDEELWMHHDLQ